MSRELKGIIVRVLPTDNTLYGNANNPLHVGIQTYDLDKESQKECSLIKMIPEEEIPVSTTVRTGISKESIEQDIENEPGSWIPLKEGLKKIHAILKAAHDGGWWSIGFNHVSYDMKILNDNFRKFGMEEICFDREKTIDLMMVAENILDFRKVGSFNFPTVYSMLCASKSGILPEYFQTTRTDVEFECRCLVELVSRTVNIDEDFQDLWNFAHGPRKITGMTFGKYKGLTLEEVAVKDNGYLCWIIRNKEIGQKNPNLVQSCKDVLLGLP